MGFFDYNLFDNLFEFWRQTDKLTARQMQTARLLTVKLKSNTAIQ